VAFALDDQAISIMFDFMKPVPARRELWFRASECTVRTHLYACPEHKFAVDRNKVKILSEKSQLGSGGDRYESSSVSVVEAPGGNLSLQDSQSAI
jgi:hypothetical protein